MAAAAVGVVVVVVVVVAGIVVRVNRLLEQTKKCSYVFLSMLCQISTHSKSPEVNLQHSCFRRLCGPKPKVTLDTGT